MAQVQMARIQASTLLDRRIPDIVAHRTYGWLQGDNWGHLEFWFQ